MYTNILPETLDLTQLIPNCEDMRARMYDDTEYDCDCSVNSFLTYQNFGAVTLAVDVRGASGLYSLLENNVKELFKEHANPRHPLKHREKFLNERSVLVKGIPNIGGNYQVWYTPPQDETETEINAKLERYRDYYANKWGYRALVVQATVSHPSDERFTFQTQTERIVESDASHIVLLSHLNDMWTELRNKVLTGTRE